MTGTFPVTGPIALLPEDDVDTDIIYPARFLLLTEKEGLGRYAFADRRDRPDFTLPTDGSTPILVAGANFGCGSSREQAVWALADFGFQVVIAPSFGDIFYVNCVRNAVLPVRLPAETIGGLQAHAGTILTVDLAAREIRGTAIDTIPFEIADGYREALLKGWDETLRIRNLFGGSIEVFEAVQRKHAPWLWADRR